MAAVAAHPTNKTARAWCFTENNPTRTVLFPDGLPDGIKYIVYQLERGEAGTPHLQGYVYFAKQQRMSWIKKITSKTAEGVVFTVFERAHLLEAKGNAEQNKTYCTKAEGRLEGPWEIGTMPKGQGERTDLAAAAASLMKDGDIRAVDPAVFLKYASGCLKLAALAPPPRRDNLKVVTIIGPTGIGKSYAVHDMFPDIYVVNMGNSGLWWDGYVGQKTVMFEEFKGQVQLQKMLQILDPYPLRLEIKGGLVPARFERVFITSNYTPDKWYKNEGGFRDAEMAALARRLDAGDPTAIPVKPDGPRYIAVNTRAELHSRLNMLVAAGIITKDIAAAPPPRAPTPIMIDDDEDMQPADEPQAAAAAPAAAPRPPPTPTAADDVWIPDDHCSLKRQCATLGMDMYVDENGDYHVNDEILNQWKQ